MNYYLPELTKTEFDLYPSKIFIYCELKYALNTFCLFKILQNVFFVQWFIAKLTGNVN